MSQSDRKRRASESAALSAIAADSAGPVLAHAPSLGSAVNKPYAWSSNVGAYTFRVHRIFAAMHGAVRGTMIPHTMSFIAITALDKGLSASEEKVYATLIAWLPSLAMFTAPYWHQDRKSLGKYLRFAAWIGRFLPLCLFAFVSEPWQVVALITFSTFISAGFQPVQNTIFASNYQAAERERFYGKAKLWMIPAFIAANLAFLRWMDHWPDAYRVVLPVSGLIALISMYILRSIKVRRTSAAPMQVSARMPVVGESKRRASFGRALSPFQSAVKMLLRDRNFGLYEIGFMCYGMGFMMLLPVVPNYYKNVFPEISYTEYSVHTALAFQGKMFLTHIALKGRHSGWSPARIAGTAFALLSGYPLMLILGEQTQLLWVALIGFLIYGVGMTLVDYAWSLGPVRFAKGGDATPYVSAHTMMVGVRALFAFPLSLTVMLLSNEAYWPVLSLTLGFLISGVACNALLASRLRGDEGEGMWVRKES